MGAGRPRFELLLEDLGGEVPLAIRLRSALKRLSRSFGFKCLRVAEVPTAAEDLVPAEAPDARQSPEGKPIRRRQF
jgi:hypothetical protein